MIKTRFNLTDYETSNGRSSNVKLVSYETYPAVSTKYKYMQIPPPELQLMFYKSNSGDIRAR